MHGLTVISTQNTPLLHAIKSTITLNDSHTSKEIIYENHHTCIISTRGNTYPISVKTYQGYRVIIEGMIYNLPDKNIEKAIIERIESMQFSNENLINYGNWIKTLYGEFIIIVINENNNDIWIINDRFSQLPAFYSCRKDIFLFSRNLHLIANHSDKEIEPLALFQHLSLGYCLEDKTVFKGIYRFLPASLFYLDNGTPLLKSELYTPRFDQYNQNTIHKNAQILAKLFTEGISQFLAKQNGEILLSLSGGLDSRANLAVVMNQKKMFKAVTFLDADNDALKDTHQIKKIHQHQPFSWELIHLPHCKKDSYEKLHQIKQGLNNLCMGFIIPFFEKLKSKYPQHQTYMTGDAGDKFLSKITPNITLHSRKALCYYTLYKEQVFPLHIASQILSIPPSEMVASLNAVYEKSQSKTLCSQYKEYFFNQRARNCLFEGEDRNRYYFWSHSPFHNPTFFDFSITCPDSQKSNQCLRNRFSNLLNPRLFAFPDVTLGDTNSMKYYLTHYIKRFLKNIYFRLPFPLISHLKHYAELKKKPLKDETAHLLNQSLKALSQEARTLINPQALTLFIEKRKISNPQGECLLGILMTLNKLNASTPHTTVDDDTKHAQSLR